MKSKFAAAMRRATMATRAFNLPGATRMIQKTLAKSMISRAKRWNALGDPTTSTCIEKQAKRRVSSKPAVSGQTISKTKLVSGNVAKTPESIARVPARLRRPLGEVVQTLRTGVAAGLPLPAFTFDLGEKAPDLPVPSGASFTARSFTSKAGSREFRLYVPASANGKPKGLILMLHGCTQNPGDFAAGTNMNALAEAHGLLVVYPHQTRASNASACWNWFEEGHQRREVGEPAILAGMTRKLISEFGIDKTKVFVAGLSAGAAMAVIMAKTYPDVFRAVGVHSGLAYQSAGNVMSALAVMRGNTGSRLFGKAQSKAEKSEPVRTIIFHGSADRTVHPSNAQQILDMAYGPGDHQPSVTTSGTSNGRRFTQTVVSHVNGTPMVETWLIEGAGHAWSGGNASGSYTDAKGPDASVEMVRFFLEST